MIIVAYCYAKEVKFLYLDLRIYCASCFITAPTFPFTSILQASLLLWVCNISRGPCCSQTSSADMPLQERIKVLTGESGSVSQVQVFGGGIFSPRKHTIVIILLTTLSAHSLNMGLWDSNCLERIWVYYLVHWYWSPWICHLSLSSAGFHSCSTRAKTGSSRPDD